MIDWYTDKEVDDILVWAVDVLMDQSGWADKNRDKYTEDEAWDYFLTLIDDEEFKKYPSVPLKKQEILDLLKS